MSDPNIFISYSRADRPFTRELAKRLRRAYMEVWYDDKLHGGEVWWEEILTSIRECDVFMYLISHDSLKSTYCQAELAEAKRLHKLILPVQIRRIQEEIPETLREIQVLDMTEGLTADTITDLLAALMRLARKILQSSEPPTSPEPIPMPIFVYRTNNRGMNKMRAALLKFREKLLHLRWKRKARLLA
ncbi:MAG: toll/interleukin-1 receptor domain-containing protein, partial [Anaerolineae bacterium]|nr:toll/interleukin-1 receptor domain-containing protein [Anaerolineae bacterium]